MRKDVKGDVKRLLGSLTIDTNKIPLLVDLQALSQRQDLRDPNAPDSQEEKRLAISKFRKRIENAKALCMAGEIEANEYLRIKEQNEQEIAHWEASTGDVEHAALKLALCVQTIEKLTRLWACPPRKTGRGSSACYSSISSTISTSAASLIFV